MPVSKGKLCIDNIEFNVIFEDNGDTLVLATVAAASGDDIVRYSRRK